MSTLTSGLIRNKFRLIIQPEHKADGFIWNETRLPGTEVNVGRSISTGAFFDPNNDAFENQFDIPTVSGKLILSDYKSHLTPGLPMLQAGVGTDEDCSISGIDAQTPNFWQPIIKTGHFFDLENSLYLHSSGSVELTTTTADNVIALADRPANNEPVSFSTFYIDKVGKANLYENYNKKILFTGYSGLATRVAQPELDPVKYTTPVISGVKWQEVDTSSYEMIVDYKYSGVVRNTSITSGVSVVLTPLPTNRDQFQLPLVPALSISGTPTLQTYGEPVSVVAGSGVLALGSLGDVSGLIVASGAYTRLSGTLQDDGLVIRLESSGIWPEPGSVIVDDGFNNYEQISYTEASGNFYLSGLTRTAPLVHRDGSQVRYIVPDSEINGNQISGIDLNYNGTVNAYYSVSMSSAPTFDINTGVVTIDEASLVPRVDISLVYNRGAFICYEPNDNTVTDVRPYLNVNPLVQGTTNGMLWFGTYSPRPKNIELSFSKDSDVSGLVGPIYAGNDYLSVTAKVTDAEGSPVPSEQVALAFDAINNIGKVDGNDPFTTAISKSTNAAGEAHFIYTPPETIHGLGYFASSASVVNGSGLQFTKQFDIKEVYDTDWINLTYAVWSNDSYDTFSEVNTPFEYTADGRFEVVSKIETAGTSSSYVEFGPVKPSYALDENGTVLGTSGTVKTLVFTSGELPVDSNIGAYFVSANKRIGIGAVCPGAQTRTDSFILNLAIPSFMQGEIFFDDIESADIKSLDSLSYLTINPFRNQYLGDNRLDPRQVGNVFRIQGSKSDEYVRNKFYLIPNWTELAENKTDNAVRKQFTFRNRFIIEIQ